MKNDQVRIIAVRVLGTVVLAAGFLFFVGTAPFLAIPDEGVVIPEPVSVVSPPPLTENLAMPPPAIALGPGGLLRTQALQPTLGLFEAEFAGVDDQVGFSTREHAVPGECTNAGRRFIDQECPGCGLLGDAGTAEMLIWQQTVDGTPVVRSVSRHCIKLAPDGKAIVGTLTFGADSLDLAQRPTDTGSGHVPLIGGATRLASIRLGLWSATYDKVPRPASALQDMASALQMRGWREVSESEHLPEEAFGGQRVFTNDGSAVCVISLTRQGQEYQLTTIISLRG
jgi:hypothetical protein